MMGRVDRFKMKPQLGERIVITKALDGKYYYSGDSVKKIPLGSRGFVVGSDDIENDFGAIYKIKIGKYVVTLDRKEFVLEKVREKRANFAGSLLKRILLKGEPGVEVKRDGKEFNPKFNVREELA